MAHDLGLFRVEVLSLSLCFSLSDTQFCFSCSSMYYYVDTDFFLCFPDFFFIFYVFRKIRIFFLCFPDFLFFSD